MPKGKHKGGRRCFTNFDEEEEIKEKEEKQKAWRKAHGETEEIDEKDSSSEEEEEESDSSEEEEEGELKQAKSKGVSHLIEIENPNHVSQKPKKVTTISTSGGDKPELSRREREEIEKQRSQAHYRKMHAQGKTDEARADLERLTLIRKQREEAQQKKEEERLAKEAAASAKRDQVAKALNKKSKS